MGTRPSKVQAPRDDMAGHDTDAPACLRFPKDFIWGAATSAHQIEGGNTNFDWWDFEHQAGSGCAEPSGDTCDSYSRWRQDLAVVADLGLTSYRFSSSGAGSSQQRESGLWRHSTTTGGSVPGAGHRNRTDRDLPSLHKPALVRFSGRLGGTAVAWVNGSDSARRWGDLWAI